MADLDRRYASAQPQSQTGDIAFDAGLREYMLSVYNHMAGGVALTGVAAYALYAYAASSEAAFRMVFGGPMQMVLVLAPLFYGFYLIFRMHAMTVSGARIGFGVYATLVGLSLAYLFVIYSGQSLARVFFISAATFGATSLYGYTTRRDLTSLGSFAMMGLFGILIAMVVNFFLQSTALQFAVSVMGVGIFIGLTAYDTQKLKSVYLTYAGNGEALARSAIYGALNLYLDFINLFLFMLRLMGDRR